MCFDATDVRLEWVLEEWTVYMGTAGFDFFCCLVKSSV